MCEQNGARSIFDIENTVLINEKGKPGKALFQSKVLVKVFQGEIFIFITPING